VGRPFSPEIVLIFRGTHQVLSAEKILKGARVPIRLIPVPRRLTSDCGLAIRLAPEALPGARAALAGAGLRPLSVHRLQEDGEYGEEPF